MSFSPFALDVGLPLLQHGPMRPGFRSIEALWIGKLRMRKYHYAYPARPGNSPADRDLLEHLRYRLELKSDGTYAFGLVSGLAGKKASAENGKWRRFSDSVTLRPVTKAVATHQLTIASGGERLVMQISYNGSAAFATIQFTR